MAAHIQLNPDEIATIAIKRRYEDYVRYRLWLEREPVVAQAFTQDALQGRMGSMIKLEAHLHSSKRQLITCTTVDPNKIRSEMQHGNAKYQYRGEILDYCRTHPTENKLYQVVNVCFDEETPTLFYIRERIKIYQAAHEKGMDEVFKFYQKRFGYFPAVKYSKSPG